MRNEDKRSREGERKADAVKVGRKGGMRHGANVQKTLDGKVARLVESWDVREWFRTPNVMNACRDKEGGVTSEGESLGKMKASKFSFSPRKKGRYVCATRFW